LSLDAFLGGGVTALGLALIFLWLLINEQIVPKGRLTEVKEQLKECKDLLKEAYVVVKQQNDGVAPLLITVRELVGEVKTLLARGRR
jgi:hypothetical protein